MSDRPITKVPPFYPGQWGIPGSEDARGIRHWPRAVDLYVDGLNSIANDLADGVNPDGPLSTVQGAITRLRAMHAVSPIDHSKIHVLSMVPESVVTYEYGEGPSYVTIEGSGILGESSFTPYWESDNNALPCLDLRAPGFSILNFRLAAPSAAACIELHHADGSGNDIAIHTLILRNHFYGQTTGRYGILSHGCYNVRIEKNVFEFFHQAGGNACAIVTGTCPLAIPWRNKIVDNIFQENDNHVDVEMNGSLFEKNKFFVNGISYTAVVALRTAGGVGLGGARNIVTRNHLEGVYQTVAGGGNYTGTATDSWIGNDADSASETVPGTTVHADGRTIAIPAA